MITKWATSIANKLAELSGEDDYADTDSFNVCVYDKNGNYVTNNIWTKKLGYSRVYVIKLPIRTITLWL